jgi:methionyl aminopeptidase
MTIETDEDVEGLKRIGKVVARARDLMSAHAAPGVSTRELDAIGRHFLSTHGARPAPALLYSFPAAICISVNDELAHGVPSDRRLADGDLVNIDVSAELDGYFADTGASYPVGNVSERAVQLLETTQAALADAMVEARAGRPIRNVGRAVQRRARAGGFGVVESLCGHGVGRHVHEPPSVSNRFDPTCRERFWEGLVMTIEPFLTTGARTVYEEEDGWTLKTPDGSWGAQFEHTMIVTQGEPIVLTR